MCSRRRTAREKLHHSDGCRLAKPSGSSGGCRRLRGRCRDPHTASSTAVRKDRAPTAATPASDLERGHATPTRAHEEACAANKILRGGSVPGRLGDRDGCEKHLTGRSPQASASHSRLKSIAWAWVRARLRASAPPFLRSFFTASKEHSDDGRSWNMSKLRRRRQQHGIAGLRQAVRLREASSMLSTL